MKRALKQLEHGLHDLFVHHTPPLAASGKKALVQYLPWINLALGLLALYTVYALWHWAHLTNGLLGGGLGYGAPALANNRLDFGIWLGLIVLAAEAVLYLAAFPLTRDRKKAGWNLMLCALLVNVVYGVLMLITGYGSVFGLVTTLIGLAIGWYLLFQIRPSYSARGTAARKKA